MTRTKTEILAQARQDSAMRMLFEGLSEENALRVAWQVLSHKHSRYLSEFDPNLIDDIFAQDVLRMIQEYTAEFMTYVDVVSMDGHRVSLSVRLTTELPFKLNGSFLGLPPFPLINEAELLEVRVSGQMVIYKSQCTTDHTKNENSLSAMTSFDLVTLDRCRVEVDFFANNRWLTRHLVRIDPSVIQSHPSG
ncbi:MAG: hypothetical protein AB202_01295 [Parcubacteria bacterium C7867-007]|nr:MAG: hypothetical protein AB202_01295 [Parcubacteria bacterium C7867-007]